MTDTHAPSGTARRLLVWSVVVVVAAIMLGVLWSGSDYHTTSLRTAATDPGAPADTEPADSVSVRWSEGSGPTAVDPVGDGSVIIGDRHGLRGLDPQTGDERWHYLRSTALLCDWTAQDAVVVAVFRTDDNCDEALALDAGTGERVWYRNVNLAAEMSLASTNQLTVASTDTGVTTFGTTSNGLRWRYHPPSDCRIADSLPGDTGVAVTLDCAGVTSLVLLDGFTGKQRWSGVLPPGPARILTADGVVAVLGLDSTGALSVFGRDGATLVTLTESALVASTDVEPAAQLYGDRLAVFTGSTLVAVDTAGGGIAWVARAVTQPTLLGSGALVHDGSEFVELDLATGQVLRQIGVTGPVPATGARLDRVGSAIVVGTADTVAVYD